jgi:hypothetical protein
VEQAAAEGAAAGRDRNDDEPPPLMPCAHCGRADGAVYQMKNIHLFDPLNPSPGEEPMVYLHEACIEQFFARADGQPAEGTTASVPFMMTRDLKSQLQARGYSAAEIANLTPQKAHDIVREVAPPAAATAQGGLAEEKPVGVHAEEKPAPSHPLARLQASAARLEPSREPCAGYRPGEWPRVYRVIAAFLAGPFAKLAVDAGWTELELVGVDPEVGVARPNACGALMTNAYGSPVTQVTPLLIRFANGLAVYKARLSVANSVAVWNHRETAANECATCRIGSPP